MYKLARYQFAWQYIRRFEHGAKFYAKGRNEKYHIIKNLVPLMKAVKSGNIYRRVRVENVQTSRV